MLGPILDLSTTLWPLLHKLTTHETSVWFSRRPFTIYGGTGPAFLQHPLLDDDGDHIMHTTVALDSLLPSAFDGIACSFTTLLFPMLPCMMELELPCQCCW